VRTWRHEGATLVHVCMEAPAEKAAAAAAAAAVAQHWVQSGCRVRRQAADLLAQPTEELELSVKVVPPRLARARDRGRDLGSGSGMGRSCGGREPHLGVLELLSGVIDDAPHAARA